MPPYHITKDLLEKITAIAEKLGYINAAHLEFPKATLRKENRIKTIQSSLEIEGNTLSIEQVTAILENKRVVAPQKDLHGKIICSSIKIFPLQLQAGI